MCKCVSKVYLRVTYAHAHYIRHIIVPSDIQQKKEKEKNFTIQFGGQLQSFPANYSSLKFFDGSLYNDIIHSGEEPGLLCLFVGFQCSRISRGTALQEDGEEGEIPEWAAVNWLQLELRKCRLQWRTHVIFVQIHHGQWGHLHRELLPLPGICEFPCNYLQ